MNCQSKGRRVKRLGFSVPGREQKSLERRHVAVTGAARGIGLAIAKALCAQGAKVSLGDLDGELAKVSAVSLPNAAGFPVDVSDRQSFERFLDDAERRFGPLDVLVNNAGVMHVGPFLEEDEVRVRRMLNVNIVGTLNGMQIVLPRMLSRGGGHVVNVASTAGKVGVRGGSVYCATKHAVIGLSEAVRAELQGTNVRISVILPGPVNTELSRGIAQVPLVGVIEPEDVAAAVKNVIGTSAFEVYVPPTGGALLRVLPAIPRRVRDPLERVLHLHDAFAHIDREARAAYESRVAGSEATVPRPLAGAGDRDQP
jgi:NADP-dependent 3-hydroxy acid dehydrogenase YdfG